MDNQESLGWFGKLPCVGDFCSHGISTTLESTLDCTLSTAMQLAVEKHAEHWEQAYFNAPVHGFVWNHESNHSESTGPFFTLGVLMPSVDRAGRAFPFVLIKQFERHHVAHSLRFVQTWMNKAFHIASSALDDEWPLERLRTCRIQADHGFSTHNETEKLDLDDLMSWPEVGMCNWYLLGQLNPPPLQPVLTSQGFSQPQALLSLWKLHSL